MLLELRLMFELIFAPPQSDFFPDYVYKMYLIKIVNYA